jgi:hypothetical protein
LGIAGGLAVTQGLVTRQQVFSPRTVALTRLASGSGIEALLGGVPAAPPTATPAPAVTRVPPPSTVPTPLMSTEAGAQALLARYRPVVRYDSMESYYADSAGVITDRPGNRLMRSDGTTLVPGPVGGALTLDLLRPGQYDADTPVQNTDYVKEVGSDYVAQARQMHRLPGYGDRVHGRAVRDASGSWWLQYWFFMYYDDPGFLGFGRHEGDLEMIQLRLDAQGAPNAASYSQHRTGVRAAWNQLETAVTPDGLAPVTYSARGSHANLLRVGTSISARSFLPDHNDGQGYRVRPELVVLGDAGPTWALWPGSWGGTHAGGSLGSVGIEANSPTAPNRHLAWHQPDVFHASCDPPADDLPAPGQPMGLALARPPAPRLTVEQDPQATLVHYAVAPEGTAPASAKIVASLVSKDPSVPAHTVSEDMSGTTGTVSLPPAPEGYEVRASVHTENGVGSATQRADV